ncbi:MAG: xanthine dehydrogenase accessory protein XdhC [Paracoccus sp. (in: a-proteobacteria)]|uniref:xanthine dehydrogenase accessory protein XdhC n=1 Tax=Paracoccus sp. TaxID=267 RepID=UPI0026E05912|nr:xanthine dehydrogenase accessory protein XdhC [Paracoccus sp. (in: a-proteobacteria)]MDO5620244.1 xanthine dehydrogenase accessory protein XdhC [Paracoccus sp. (in: a-proteobacteria)]
MIRVRVERLRGSAPREVGAWMLVLPHDTQGSIGGGALESIAIDKARAMLKAGQDSAHLETALGPEIAQCCGGWVALSFQRVDTAPAADPRHDLLIFGAGHVGRALARAAVLLPLNVSVYDQRAEELARLDAGRSHLTALPEAAIRAARPGSAFVIATHDHALDFALATEALRRGDAAYIGLIGSATKRARFDAHVRREGLDPGPLICPIGAGFSPDKRPEIIAAFTAAEIIATLTKGPKCAS